MGSVPFVASSQVQTNKSESKKYSMKFSKKLKLIKKLKIDIYIYIYSHHQNPTKIYLLNTPPIRKMYKALEKKRVLLLFCQIVLIFLPPLMPGINEKIIYYLPLDIYKYDSFGN
jgi:hypothetical protein